MDFEKYIRNAQRLQCMVPGQAILNSIAFRNNLANYSHSYISSYNWINQYNNIISNLRPSFLDTIRSYQNIVSNIPLSHIDIASTYIPTNVAINFSSISSDILNSLDDDNIPEQLLNDKCVAKKLSTAKKPLTWQDIFTIISLILAIFSFVQGLLPDSEILKLENSIQQLTNIITEELNQTGYYTTE